MLLTDLGHIIVSYVCPECNRRVERKLPYIKKDKAQKKLESAGWCSGFYCEARHKFTYSVLERKKQQPKIKKLLFLSNEKEYNKKLQILSSC